MRCSACNQNLQKSAFHCDASKRSGRSHRCKRCEQLRGVKYRQKHRSARRNYVVRHRAEITEQAYYSYILAQYGLSKAAHTKMLADQKGLCAICERPEVSRYKGTLVRLSVDHCHKTGKVRGLLCHRCNTTLGRVSDDPQLLYKMCEYLDRHHAQPGCRDH